MASACKIIHHLWPLNEGVAHKKGGNEALSLTGGIGGMGTLVARATKDANKIEFSPKFISVFSGFSLSVVLVYQF